jgi:hypothetical protein
MIATSRIIAGAAVTAALLWATAGCSTGAPAIAMKETRMTLTATGPFEVKLNPEAPTAAASAAGLSRLSLDKQFHGDLQARSQGEMIAFRSPVEGSAGYVAMETVTGSLHGRQGSFTLQHSSTMRRGAPAQSISVVPESGTGELTRLEGRMTIVIDRGRHSYQFEYTLPEAR